MRTYGPDDATPPRSPQALASRIRVESELTPQSLPPTAIQVRGKGWSVNLPVILVTALLSAMGARFLPTNTSTDVSVERAALAAERNALEAEKFRQEFRQELAALRMQIDSTSDKLNNRLAALEARAREQK